MNTKKSLRATTALLALSLAAPTMRSHSERVPPVAGIATFAAATALACGGLFTTDRGKKFAEKYDGKAGWVAGILAVLGATALGRFVYSRLKKGTPTAKYKAARSFVDALESKLEKEDSVVLPSDRRALKEILDTFIGLHKEIAGQERYASLRDDIQELVERIMIMHLDAARRGADIFVTQHLLASLASEHIDSYDDTQLLSYLHSLFPHQETLAQESRQVFGTAAIVIDQAVQAAHVVVEYTPKVTDVNQNLQEMMDEAHTIRETLSIVRARLERSSVLIENYLRYLNALEVRDEIVSSELLALVKQAPKNEQAFLEYFLSDLSEAASASGYSRKLHGLYNRVVQARKDVEMLMESGGAQAFTQDLASLHRSLRNEEQTLQCSAQIFSKQADVDAAQSSLSNALQDTHVKQLLQRKVSATRDRLNDGELWDWARTVWGSSWSRTLSKRLETAKKDLADVELHTDVGLANNTARFLDAQLEHLRRSSRELTHEADINLFLISINGDYLYALSSFESFVSRTRLRSMLTSSFIGEMITGLTTGREEDTLRKFKSIFSQSTWPLLDAEKECNRTLSTLNSMLRRFERIVQKAGGSAERLQLLVRVSAARNRVRSSISTLEGHRSRLIQSAEYATQVQEKAQSQAAAPAPSAPPAAAPAPQAYVPPAYPAPSAPPATSPPRYTPPVPSAPPPGPADAPPAYTPTQYPTPSAPPPDAWAYDDAPPSYGDVAPPPYTKQA